MVKKIRTRSFTMKINKIITLLGLLILAPCRGMQLETQIQEKQPISNSVKNELISLVRAELTQGPQDISRKSDYKLQQIATASKSLLADKAEVARIAQTLKTNKQQLTQALNNIWQQAHTALNTSTKRTAQLTTLTTSVQKPQIEKIISPLPTPPLPKQPALVTQTNLAEEASKTPVLQVPSVILISSDGKEFTIAQSTAELSQTIKNMISDVGASEGIPFTNISSKDLEIIVSHLRAIENLKRNPGNKYNLRQVRVTLRPQVKNLTQQELIDLLLIANYLDTPPLIHAYAVFLVMTVPESLYTATFGSGTIFVPQNDKFQKYFANVLQGTGKNIPAELIQYIVSIDESVIKEEKTKYNKNGPLERTLKLFTILGQKKSDQNTAQMKQLVQEGIYPNMTSEYQETPLLKAISYSQNDIAIDLIKAGADVNATDENGRTPLMKLAALSDFRKPCTHLEIFKALLNANANLNAKDKSNKTALSIATTVAHIPIMKELQKAGAQ